MSVYYGYKNRLWKQINAFSFTGSPQQFTLQPGTYLLECCGALGGISKQQNSFRAYGGVSYGILSLEEAKTMYAYVGGNGEDVPDEQPTAGRGGWNGGGNGGLGSVGYYGGAGGGGASDIRLFTPNDVPDPPRYYPTIPPEYQQIEYIDTTNIDQYINTGFIPSKYTTIDFKTSFLDSETGNMCIFGARVNSNAGNRWDCWLSNYYQTSPFINSVYGSRTYNQNDNLLTGIQSGQPAVYKLTPATIHINNIERKTYSSSSGSPSASLPLYLLGLNENSVYSQTYQFHGKLYHFRAQHSGPATQWTFMGSIQCSVNGRVYTTANVPQITCIAYGSGWRGPFVISKVNPGGALYSPYGEIRTFTYNGETYYNSSTGGWWGGESGGDEMGNVPRAPFQMSNVYDPDAFARAMLDYVYNITPNPFDYNPNIVKDVELVPVKRLSDNAIGMYDTVRENFYTGEITGTSFAAGPEGTYYIDDGVDTDKEAYKNTATLLSRFIVAGGSGGSAGFDYVSNKSPNYANFGGGTNGGPLFATNGGTTNGKYASQTSGNSFGIGQDAVDRESGSYNDNGASGGGGGWYGGHAIQTTSTYGLAGPGGGGSGFVYTNTSTTPEGYIVGEDCQLTAAYTFANKSTQSSIKIFEPISEDSLESCDIIKFISTGTMSSVTLNPGTYLLKCKGCDGSVRYDINESPRGGYSEGVLSLAEPTVLKAFVGGTGIGDNLLSNSYVRETFPDISANGGGMPLTLGGGFTGHSGGAGSGATDFRIVSGGIDILPDGYTQLEYFRVSGTQYLDTGYIPTAADDISIECCPYKGGSDWTSIGGAGIDQWNNDLSFWTRYNDTIGLHRGATYLNAAYTQTLGTKFTIGNIVNVLYADGVQRGSIPDVPTLNCVRTFYLGCNHFGSTYHYNSNFQYHRFYIHNNGSLVVDMYPCIEMSTGIVGMYDIVREHFYPGTGGLIAGPAVYGSASAFTRVIVAGGAGGCGGNVGGTGGGTTGGTPQGSSGTNEGPGTQTESPQSSSYYIVNGGFGYGGNSASTGNGYSSGVSGGAGGGGWYGGAGTYPSGSSDNQKGGAGGSGFVFTENSVVPEEYLLSDIYHLEDASTIAGGNNSPIGLAEASIEVIDISSSYILCRDAEGIKGFNSETHEWEHIADELTPELFIEYGVYTFKSDAGLLDEYDILVNDADNISAILFDVVPAKQHVRYETVTPMTVDRIDFDTEYDRNLFDVNINVKRQPRGSATKIIIDVGINKRSETSKRAKVYSGVMMSK